MSAAPAAELKPCPACGKAAGELKRLIAARFPFYVRCSACGHSTDAARLPGAAVGLWNATKPAPKAKTP